MLSGFIDISKEGVEDHPDYSGYKFTNYLLMRNFNKKFPCFSNEVNNIREFKKLIFANLLKLISYSMIDKNDFT